VSIARTLTSTVHLNKESYMKADKARRAKALSLVERMLELHKALLARTRIESVSW